MFRRSKVACKLIRHPLALTAKKVTVTENQSLIASKKKQGKRSVKKVPFVELFSGRVQGVVSSGSDIKRVYVTFIEASTGNFYCCTNNNRVCGGMRGGGCKHLNQMIDEAILQFSGDSVAKYLGIKSDGEIKSAYDITKKLTMNLTKESPGVVFSRFLNYLRYCELKANQGSVPEMSWFSS